VKTGSREAHSVDPFSGTRALDRISMPTHKNARHKVLSVQRTVSPGMDYSNGKVAGALIFVAVTQFVLGVIVAEALYPGYSISDNYLSELGTGPSSMIFNLSVFLRGLLLIIGAYFLHRAFNFTMLTLTLVLAAVGSMGVGIFTLDIALIHNIVSWLFFLFSGLSAIFAVVCSHVHGFKLMKMPFSAISIILGLIELGGFALFVGGIDFGLGVGGMQRMVIYPVLLWLAGFGGYLMAHPDRPRTQKTQ